MHSVLALDCSFAPFHSESSKCLFRNWKHVITIQSLNTMFRIGRAWCTFCCNLNANAFFDFKIGERARNRATEMRTKKVLWIVSVCTYTRCKGRIVITITPNACDERRSQKDNQSNASEQNRWTWFDCIGKQGPW